MAMAHKISREQALKENVIRLIKHHRKYCEGETCDISLSQILELLEASENAGLKFTDEEKRLFY
jgi:hypothetical protein